MEEAQRRVRTFAEEVAARVAAADLGARAARYAVPGRLSGSPQLETVLGRVAEDLRALGLRVREARVRALTSRPGRALVRLGGTIYPGQSAAFAGPAVDRRGPVCPLAGHDPVEWFDHIVLLDALPTADVVALAEASGARALVCLVPAAGPYLVSVSPVWGSPTPWTVGNLPSIPVAVLAGEVAAALHGRLEAVLDSDGRPPSLTVTAGVDTRWRDIPLLTADIPGPGDDFVLAGAHADAWLDGAMDNAAGVAALVEAAAAIQGSGPLERALRLAVWSGHEDGGRAASQAYADGHWQELERRASAYVQISAPGGRGNVDLGALAAAPEVAFLVRDAVAAVAHTAWPSGALPAYEADDRSFAGIGVASARVGGGRPADDPGWPRGRAWHSPEDRLDHLDAAILARDGAVAGHVLAHAAARPLEPVDLAAGARALEAALAVWSERLAGHLDLSGAMGRGRSLVARAEALAQALARVGDAPGSDLNRALRKAGRPIVRLGSTATSRFDHDAALPLGPLPTLAACESLLGSPPGSAPADLAAVAAGRARTAVEVSLDEAGERVDDALALVDPPRRRR